MLKRVDNFRQQPGFQPIGFVDNLMNRGPFLSITAQIYHRRTPLVKRSGKIFSKMWKKLPIFAYLCCVKPMSQNPWMMVTVPHIAVASYPDALPFIYGIRHAPDFRVGELLAATPERCAELFLEGETDLALVPAALVPDLHDADLVTEYCVGATGPSRLALLLSNDAPESLRRVFIDPQSPTAAHLAAYVLGKRWGLTPQYIPLDDTEQLFRVETGDGFVLGGGKAADAEGLFARSMDLTGEWCAIEQLPVAMAVWVARKGTDPLHIEELEYALTYGLEHTFEAVRESVPDEALLEIYGHLSNDIDYLFDLEKHKALKRLWSSGVKNALRTNPG